MAIYFFNIKTFGRASGGSAPGAAAYRAGERIRDERTGRMHDHSMREDVLHKEILLPEKYSTDDMTWARDRTTLWNAAERAEKRSNARVAREYLVGLPFELSPEERLKLARGFSQELTNRHGFALDLTIHAPRNLPDSDSRNFHAHLLATTREVNLEGLGEKTSLERSYGVLLKMGLDPVIHELFHARERWALLTNAALREANVAATVDYRSLEAQGIDREPRPQIPRAAFEMERQGYRNALAERMRSEYEARVNERQQGLAQPEPVSRPPQSLEEIRREAREDWLRMRQALGAGAGPVQRQPDRTLDDDLSR